MTDQLALFEERAAIMEFDGGMSKWMAEREASKDIAKIIRMTYAERELFEGTGWGASKAMRYKLRNHDREN